MKLFNNIVKWADSFQQKHRFFGFIFAVIKKYNDDEAGRQAALLTYYSFLSLFPLLLVITTIADILIGTNSPLKTTILHGITSYFPLLGNQLSTHVHRLHAGGLALFAGLLFTFYGTRGVANEFSRSVQDIWLIPKDKRDKFPETLFKSIGLIITGGLGFIAASVISGLTSATGHGLILRLLSLVVNFILLFFVFRFLLNLSLPRRLTGKESKIGAIVAAVGLLICQSLGVYLLKGELQHLNAVYSYFAVTLALLFWLYLQAQVLYYSMEIAIVSSKKLWPRSLTAPVTVADQKLPRY